MDMKPIRTSTRIHAKKKKTPTTEILWIQRIMNIKP